jgi:hypothetical protein
MIMIWLHRVNLLFAVLATWAPLAHVVELPNKLALDGALWLAIQQHLYRGWGPLLGGPAEIGALATTLGVLYARRADARTRQLSALAALAYVIMVAAFFVFNAPVNAAVNGWTAGTLPGNWAQYRLRWEVGHSLAALLSVMALAALVRARLMEIARAARPERPCRRNDPP